ncbi:MAG: SBBP repeat-containing protein [Bryobacteraceae bacterium]
MVNTTWAMVLGLLLCARAAFPAGSARVDLAGLPLAFESASGGFLARTPATAIRLTSTSIQADASDGALVERFEGADPRAVMQPEEKLAGRASSLIGSASSKWTIDAPTWRRLRVKNLYPNIDLVYYGNHRQLEFDFVLAPGAEPSRIRMTFESAASVRIAENGDLRIGGFRQHRPVVYQEIHGVRRKINGWFRVEGKTVRFELAAYDHAQSLTIDPVLSYSTFLGGSNTDAAYAMAVDSTGNTYIAGETYSIDYPRLGQTQTYQGSKDIFVTKLNSAGTAVVYSTYIGGSSNDAARAIAIDSGGSVYLTGQTYSVNFPTTGGSYQLNNAGNADAFVLKLNAVGNGFIYSTYLGAAGNEMGLAIAVDSGGAAYVAGYTDSTAFPVTAGAAQAAHRGGIYDGWIVKLSAAGSTRVYGTYIGGAGLDVVNAIAIDTAGNAYVAGQTDSADFPVVNAYQASRAGNSDAFLAKINASGSAFTYSTYLGGTSADQAFGVAVDSSGNAYVAGSTYSSNFPVTNGAFQTAWQGLYDAFVTKVNATGSGLVYSTYLGAAGNDIATAVRVSSAGLAWVAGYTDSTSFPLQGAVQSTNRGGRDGFVTALSATGASISFSTYLGGSAEDVITALAVDSASNAYVTGYTASTDMTVTAGVFQPVMVRSYDAFVAAIRQSAATPPTSLSVSPASGTGTTQTFQFRFSDASGYGNLTAVDMQFQSVLNGAFGCFASYNPLNGVVTLTNDAGTGSAGSAAFGSGTVLQNGQCQINTGGSTASGSGTTLTVNLSVTFKLAFVGGKNSYGRAGNSGALSSGWVLLGTWSVVSANQPPTVVSILPSNGAGLNQSFNFAFSDANGYTDLNTVYVQVSTAFNTNPGCSLWYTLSTNTVYLVNDTGSDAFGPYTLGVPGTVQNSQCAVNLGSSGVTALGNNLTLTISYSFKAAYSGSKLTYAFAQDNAGSLTGWQRLGTWTVGAANQPPTVAGVTPASGSGTSQIFNFIFSDGNGFADLSTVYGQISPTLHAAPGCSFWYTRPTNVLFLINDAGNNATGPFTVGATGIAQNGQCSIDLGNSGTSTSGNNLVVSVSVTFKAGYSGSKGVYAYASDNPGLGSGWQTIGAWTVP